MTVGGDTRDYHRAELAIALDANDPRRTVPPLAGARRVLDIGCGAGQTLIALRHDNAIGVDLDVQALRFGRALADEHGAAHALAAARGEALPFRDAAFDFVYSRVALPYMHLATALREQARVLVPGGRLWLVLHGLEKTLSELRTDLRARRWRALPRRFAVLANGVALHATGRQFALPGGRGHESFQTRGGIRRALHAAGFIDVAFPRSRAFVVEARKRG